MKLAATAILLNAISVLVSPNHVAAQSYDGYCDTPAQVAQLPPRHWCEVPSSPLKAAEKLPQEFDDWNGKQSEMYQSYQRVMGIDGVTRAWNGAALDTKRNCLLVTGGGHNDYGGNEVYSFCLNDLKWERLTDPTAFPNRAPQTANPDGTPISRHTYGGLAYISTADRLFMFDGAPDGRGGCGTAGTWTYDLTEREKTGSYSPNQWELRTSENEPRRGCDNAAVYDPATDTVIFKSDGTYAYSFDQDHWKKVTNIGRLNPQISLAIDIDRRYMVEVGGGVTALWEIDRKFRGGPAATDGPKTIEDSDDPGIAYDSAAERIVGWHGGTTVYTFDSESRTWTAIPPASTNIIDPGAVSTSGGVFGRFAYSAAYNVFVYVDRVEDNVLLYRLTEGDSDSSGPKPLN